MQMERSVFVFMIRKGAEGEMNDRNPKQSALIPNCPYKPEDQEKLVRRWGTHAKWQDYAKLEASYAAISEDMQGALSPRTKMNLRDICEWRLARDKALADGDTMSAKRLTEMINKTLDQEALSVKDSNAVKLDTLVQKLEDAGLMVDGELELQKVIGYIKNDFGHYTISKDAIDQCMLMIYNTMRENAGMSKLAYPPEWMHVDNSHGEFLERPTPMEMDAMNEFGCLVSPAGMDGGDKK